MATVVALPKSSKPESADKAKPKKSKRRLATEKKLVEAVGTVIQQRGVDALGVNALAVAAGVDKVLIYRYFDGLEGLLRAYGESADFWPSVEELLGEDDEVLREVDPGRVAARVFRNYVEALRRRPVTLALLAWECVERNELVAILEDVRERRSEQLFRRIGASGFPLHGGTAELAALVSAGLSYLCVRARHIRIYGGVRLDEPEGWEPIFEGLERAFRALAAED